MTNWQRAGYVRMTETSLAVLRRLRELKAEGWDFVSLDWVHYRTLRFLEREDLVVASRKGFDDGVRYRVTGRGLKTLAAYERPVKRTDGICIRCGERPKGVYSSGKLKAYCDGCLREAQNRQYAMKGYQLDADAPCSRCGWRRRVILPNGQAIAYCGVCRKANRKQERRRKMKRKLAAIARGEVFACSRCGAKVYHTAKNVYDYCYGCYRQQQNECARKRKAAAFACLINQKEGEKADG